MHKIKILYTIPNFDTAGSGKVLYDLAKGMDASKFEIAIACGNSKGAFFQEVEHLGIPIHILRTTVSLRPYFNLLFRIKPFREFVKQNQFDIVHSWHWSSDWTEVLASRFGDAKFVYTKKAMTWGNVHWKIRSYLSSFIVTTNTEMQNYFRYKKNQKLIPFGVDTDWYNPELFPKKIQEKPIFKIITVANLVPVKAIEVLIKAVHLLNDPLIQLEVLGDARGDYAATLQHMVLDLKLQNQIFFLGKHNDVRPFLAQADLYVISSKKEGMPMALVEAMSMRIPVLGSNISGINFVLKDFPDLLFEASNSNDLEKKIGLYLRKSDSERQKIGLQLRQYCVENFSMEKFIKEHEDLYSKLVQK